ncbi:hypothetical protein VTN77DRAFT_1064 [Rasamsonia byssochlamydoides]|uniref:uncharacterized protein n=1 Tax=Rasamsonia byssochlamydoides TaxID=89139 RepID=UPI0037435248
MATAITIQPSSGPAGTRAALASDPHHLVRPRMNSAVSSDSPSSLLSTVTPPTSCLAILPRRDGVSCDACLQRRSRCAMNELVNKCYSCEFHRQDCTFTVANSNLPLSGDAPASRKRKLDEIGDGEPVKRQPNDASYSPESTAKDMSRPSTRATEVASPKLSCQTSQHIGMTTELEPILLEHLPLDANDESVLAASHRVRRLGEDGTFMRMIDSPPSVETSSVSLDAIENLVAPYGSTLVDKFFQRIHPVFPVLMEDAFRQAYRTRRGLSPLLLSAVYLLALKFLDVEPGSRTVRTPDAGRLESTALKLLTEALPRAHITTIQAGLLLMQKSSINTSSLNAQLVTAAFELGLHQDCTNWKIGTAEKGLRKRMAWALYMQDKWSALMHGRPSHMSAANWTVRDLVEEDFVGAFPAVKREDGSIIGHGPLLFCQHVALTAILADILDNFYTLKAVELFNASGNNQTRFILERAKPVQIRLKEWFARLPPQLKMDNTLSGDLFEELTEETACNGALHVAYFATEITLHRCIVRSLSPETADNYLSHICRSAAKTRLISAMDFVNRLRPAHLRSFWPAPSRTNFALIGSFGTLLLATAPTREEAEFYRMRLGEYRWTLSVSVKNAEFLNFAIESLDLATSLAKNVPEKPGIEELMAAASSKTAPRTSQAQRPGTSDASSRPMLESGGAEAGAGSGAATERAGSSSVVSGLASPATSTSGSEEPEDTDTFPPL